MKNIVNPRIKKAENIFKSAKVLFENGQYNCCISRCYYCIFHICIVLLEKFNITQKEWNHKFVISSFNREFIHRRKFFKREVIDFIYKIFYNRATADYNLYEFSEKEAKRSLDKTKENFYNIIRVYDEKQ